jgi:UbiD family decarboxylase
VALADLRGFLQQADALGELKVIHGADRNLEIGAITELSLQHDGPALLFDGIPGYPAGFRVASNVCSTARRTLLALGMDPDLEEEQALALLKERISHYRPVPPAVVDSGPVLQNAVSGDDVDLGIFPVPIWHEMDGAPYIGTGHGIIQQDPETGVINFGTYRGQLHDRRTTGIFFTLPTKDGARIMRKYWAQGKACPVAASYGPEPLLFLSGCSSNGIPPGTPEYEYTGFIADEPVPVIRGPLTGLPIPASSEIAIEGEIPPPDEESRDEGPFGEWTGYYWGVATKEAVVRVKALYFRDDPILYGAPPLKYHKGYAVGMRMQGLRGGMLSRFEELELPVKAVTSLGPLGTTVVSVHQEQPDDVARVMDELDRMSMNNRLIFLVDDDVNASDPWDVLWAVGTRFDPDQARVSIVDSSWNLDPMMTLAERTRNQPIPYKRMIINGCRPFERLADFPPVNTFGDQRRRETWEKWQMADWLARAPRVIAYRS